MHTLFIRITAVLFLTFFVGLVVLIDVGLSSYARQLAERHAEDAGRLHAVLAPELDKLPERYWQSHLKYAEAISALDIEIVEADLQMDGSDSAVMHLHSTWADDTMRVTHPIDDAGTRWLSYTRTYPSQLAGEDGLTLVLLFIAVPLVLFFVLRPIARKISELSGVAQSYAAGRLDERSTLPAPRPLEELANNFHGMASSLSQKILEQRIMTHAVSHELKTPLTRMRMASDLAQRETDPRAWKRCLDDFDEDLTLLETVMDETLMLSRFTLQDKPLEWSPIDMCALIAECLAECTTGQREISLDVAVGTTALGNRDAIKRVLVNILVNAQRFSNTRIDISARISGNRCIIAIADDGPGLQAKHHRNVFMPLRRTGHGRLRVNSGTGMGLAIAALLVEKNQGRIWLDETGVGGACFCVSLPRPQE